MACSRCAILIRSAAFFRAAGRSALFDLPWMPDLSWHLLPLSFLDRRHRAGRRVGAGCHHYPDRNANARPGQGVCAVCGVAQCAGRRGTAKRRSSAGHGHAAAGCACVGGRPIRSILRRTRPRAMSQAGSAGCRRYSVRFCSRWFLRLAPILVINQEFDGGHHHCRIDPDGAGACARRDGDRELERIRRRPPIGTAAGSAVEALAQGGGAAWRCRRRPKRLRSSNSMSARRIRRS